MSSEQFLEQRKKAKHSKLMCVGFRSALSPRAQNQLPHYNFLTDD
jgi:hypothetical protein